MAVIDNEISASDVRAELRRIADSDDFDASERNRQFLEYVVEQTLAGRSDRIKAYSIATIVFGRDDSFDPQVDPIVRIEASRLRRSLERYYLTAGSEDRLRITIPKGGYVPVFEIIGEESGIAVADAGPHATEGPEPARDPPRKSSRLLQGAAAFAGLAVALLVAAWFGRFPPFDEPVAEAPAARNGPAIFVAPFVEDGDTSAFPNLTRGFTREVIVGLTRFSDLLVFGSEMTYGYGAEGTPPRTISDLGIDFLLTGGVRIYADRFVVNALLTEVKSGRHIWAERIERPLGADSIFQARDDIANRIAQVLAQPYGVIFAQKAKESDGKPPSSLTSYDCVIRFYQYWKTFDRDSYASIRTCLERAVADDPQYAEAHAVLSLTYSDGYRFGFDDGTTTEKLIESSLAYARRAVELAPNATRGYHALMLAYWFVKEVELGLEAGRTGLALNPNDTELMAELGARYVMRLERAKGLPLLHRAFALNPAQPSLYRIALFIDHYYHERYKEALAAAQQIEAPFIIYGHAAVAMAAAQLGRKQEAAAAVARIHSLDPRFGDRFVSGLQARGVHPDLIPIFVDGLRKAGLNIPEGPGAGRS